MIMMLQLLIKDATTPHANDDEQFNELFDNLMDNLIGSEDDDSGETSEVEYKVDYIIDEENNIQDVDVDMTYFILNVHTDLEGGCVNDLHADDEPEDMEVINNEEFDLLDEGSDQDKQRRALIKNC
uniref:Uncharacterized protein n=1 Tax=Lactuca sativa TaxID=4236 RepID=A0A9R1WSP5_LACSA|nr:hypothetical protein LSAT_V11C100029940 [Lactuca sativa]